MELLLKKIKNKKIHTLQSEFFSPRFRGIEGSEKLGKLSKVTEDWSTWLQPRVLLSKVCPLLFKYGPRLSICIICKLVRDPESEASLSSGLLYQNLHFNKILKWAICGLKFEKPYLGCCHLNLVVDSSCGQNVLPHCQLYLCKLPHKSIPRNSNISMFLSKWQNWNLNSS